MTQLARKELNRTISMNGMVETVKYAIVKSDIINNDEIEILKDRFKNQEDTIIVGLCIDFNNDLIWVDVDNLLIALTDYFKTVEEDEKEDYEYIIFNKLIKKLQKLKGYTIWI